MEATVCGSNCLRREATEEEPAGWIKPRKRRMTPGILPCGPSGPASPFAPLLRRSRRFAP